MTSSPDRMAILLPLSVAVTKTFCTIVIHGLGLIGIVHFLRYELRLGRAGVLERRVDRSRSHVGRTCRTFDCARRVGLGVHLMCGEFSQLAAAFYHSGMNYTTLGDSEKVMSPSWRLLAPLEAANGMLMFGVSTAMLFAVIQRLFQIRFSEPSSYDTRIQPRCERADQ